MLAGVLALLLISTLARVVTAGPLDPPGPPGSTLQRLANIPPSWHQILPANNGDGAGCNSTRFECVMGGLAVLDHETGLVWQRTVPSDPLTWPFATLSCETLEIGGRYGWRLPSHQEIRTLADTSADHLPDGNPFSGALTGGTDTFWTSSIEFFGPSDLAVYALNLDAPATQVRDQYTASYRLWCVRGAGQMDTRT
jgi:hypothetical protein